MKIHYLAFILFSSIFINSTLHAEEENMVIQVSRLTFEVANKISTAAVNACREKGIQITAAVVDRNGNLQSLSRDTIAAPVSIRISQLKAYTAANFNAATSRLSDRANTPIGQVSDLLMSAGGVPIQVGGHLLGAVGVSGAPSGETDEECAQAGINAVLEDLEMSM